MDVLECKWLIDVDIDMEIEFEKKNAKTYRLRNYIPNLFRTRCAFNITWVKVASP